MRTLPKTTSILIYTLSFGEKKFSTIPVRISIPSAIGYATRILWKPALSPSITFSSSAAMRGATAVPQELITTETTLDGYDVYFFLSDANREAMPRHIAGYTFNEVSTKADGWFDTICTDTTAVNIS
jgi:hypothetical protein